MRSFPVTWTLLALAAGALFAQQTSSRDAYRAAYRTWREAEPSLETDAATAGEALAARAALAASGAVTFGAARGAQLRQGADDQSQNVLWLQNSMPLTLPDLAPAAEMQRLVNTDATIVNTSIATFAGDADRGIKQLRQALETERMALAELGGAIDARQKSYDKVAQAGQALEPARTQALGEYQKMAGVVSQSAELVDKETAAWASYYPALAEAARAAIPAAPVISIAPAPGNPAPRTASVTSLPLVRYTGVWVYPTVNGMFHGAEPEFVDFTVHEEDGKASGTFYARFKLPPGSPGDPQVRFDFSGDFRADRIQKFELLTSDGAKGTLELIPATAFNLLEINFQVTDAPPGKIRAADLLLVKK